MYFAEYFELLSLALSDRWQALKQNKSTHLENFERRISYYLYNMASKDLA